MALDDLIAGLHMAKASAEGAAIAEVEARVRVVEDALDRVRAAVELRETLRAAMQRVSEPLCDSEIQTDRIPIALHGSYVFNLISLWFRTPGPEPKPDCVVTFATQSVRIHLVQVRVLSAAMAPPSSAALLARRVDKVGAYAQTGVLSVYAIPVQAEEALEAAVTAALRVEKFRRGCGCL